MVVVDTSVFIDHLRGYKPANDFFISLDDKDLLFSALSEAELLSGKSCNDSEQRESILQFLKRWKKIDVTNPIAMMAGDLRRTYEITLSDAIIAATAIIYNMELLTRDISDFKGIKELKIRAPY
ncbi:MAG: PIN domain-containing protein [Nanoarchaeota archaeon]